MPLLFSAAGAVSNTCIVIMLTMNVGPVFILLN